MSSQVWEFISERRASLAFDAYQHASLVLQCVLAGRLVERGRRRRRAEMRVDVVLLAAPIPGGGHLGPNPTDTVVPREEPFTRCCHRLVALRVGDPVAPCGLAHARGEG